MFDTYKRGQRLLLSYFLNQSTGNWGPYKSALIAAPRLLLRGAAIKNAAIAAAVVVFYCGAAAVLFTDEYITFTDVI